MVDWPSVDIDAGQGPEIVTYSHTPEEFVARVKRCGERVYVTKGSCTECHYTPERAVPKQAVQHSTEEALLYHRIPECLCGTIARFQRLPAVPDFLICYGFYYQFWHRNIYLLAAYEAGLVTFFDISALPALAASGLKPIVPYFY